MTHAESGFEGFSSIPVSGNPFYYPRQGEGQWPTFGAQLNLSKDKIQATLLRDVMQGLRWSAVFSATLRYCPDCLGYGYHARYFQLLALEQCPIHTKPLVNFCRNCGAEAPFYGVCEELLSRLYHCPQCEAAFFNEPVSIHKFFHPGAEMGDLYSIWQPLDEWVKKLNKLNLDLSALRNWIVDHGGTYSRERQVDALHIIAAELPLPQGGFVWKAPCIKRKAFYFTEEKALYSGGYFQENYIEEAYSRARTIIERSLSGPRIEKLLSRCKDMSWGVVDALVSESAIDELTYVLWRVKLEYVSEPALIASEQPRGRVFMDDAQFPLPFWLLDQKAWKSLFIAMYRGYRHDLRLAIEQGGSCADIVRFSPLGQCCILRSTDMYQRGRGLVAYPVQ